MLALSVTTITIDGEGVVVARMACPTSRGFEPPVGRKGSRDAFRTSTFWTLTGSTCAESHGARRDALEAFWNAKPDTKLHEGI